MRPRICPPGILTVLISAVFIEIYDTDVHICGCGKNTFDGKCGENGGGKAVWESKYGKPSREYRKTAALPDGFYNVKFSVSISSFS